MLVVGADHHRNGRLRLGAALGQAGRGNPPGDAVWFSPGENHYWHGATRTTAMTHIAIQEELNSKVVEWIEQLSDEQHRK